MMTITMMSEDHDGNDGHDAADDNDDAEQKSTRQRTYY